MENLTLCASDFGLLLHTDRGAAAVEVSAASTTTVYGFLHVVAATIKTRTLYIDLGKASQSYCCFPDVTVLATTTHHEILKRWLTKNLKNLPIC